MSTVAQPPNEHVEERLRTNTIAWFITVRKDGRPHSIPVWFLWKDGTILVFSQPHAQKIRNLRQNQHVLLSLDDTKDGSDAVTIEGTAELTELKTPELLTNEPDTAQAYLEKYGDMIKELGWTIEGLGADYSQPICITPTRFITIS